MLVSTKRRLVRTRANSRRTKMNIKVVAITMGVVPRGLVGVQLGFIVRIWTRRRHVRGFLGGLVRFLPMAVNRGFSQHLFNSTLRFFTFFRWDKGFVLSDFLMVHRDGDAEEECVHHVLRGVTSVLHVPSSGRFNVSQKMSLVRALGVVRGFNAMVPSQIR